MLHTTITDYERQQNVIHGKAHMERPTTNMETFIKTGTFCSTAAQQTNKNVSHRNVNHDRQTDKQKQTNRNIK